MSGRSKGVMRNYCITQLAKMADELKLNFAWNVEWAKANFARDDYRRVLGFTQWFIREIQDADLAQRVAHILEEERAAYRLIDGDTIAPIASEQEGRALEGAAAVLVVGGMEAARAHLMNAASQLTEGHFAESVRESVHAVESLVRTKTGKTKFSDALRELDSQSPMHGSFRSALEKLYGYASDEQGIRHPLLEAGDAKVTERDAISCSVCAPRSSPICCRRRT